MNPPTKAWSNARLARAAHVEQNDRTARLNASIAPPVLGANPSKATNRCRVSFSTADVLSTSR